MAKLSPRSISKRIARNPFCARQLGNVSVATDFKSDKERQGLGYVFCSSPDGKHFLRGSLVRGNGSGHEIVAADLISCGGGTREFSKFPIDNDRRTISLIDPPKKYVPLVAMLDILSRREGLSGPLNARSVQKGLYQIC